MIFTHVKCICVAGWEPFIEPWPCFLSWQQQAAGRLHPPRFKMGIRSKQRLDVNITSVLLGVELMKPAFFAAAQTPFCSGLFWASGGVAGALTLLKLSYSAEMCLCAPWRTVQNHQEFLDGWLLSRGRAHPQLLILPSLDGLLCWAP